MNRTALIIAWNVLLTALLAWSLLRGPGGGAAHVADPAGDTAGIAVRTPMDTAALKDARIAYFIMDSIQNNYELVKESADRVRNEGQRLEGDLMKEMGKAEARARELAAKDHTYSTKAEVEADEREFQELQQRIQQMRASSQDKIDELQIRMLQRITQEIQAYLAEYNKAAGHDYIFSIQEEGQIWVGNAGLDITQAVVDGLNARHRAAKGTKQP
jgi:outer membrane protein